MDSINVGDIFKSTWGYDQTNVDFYVVTRKTAKMIELQECGRKSLGQTSWASDKVIPDPDTRLGGKFLRRPTIYKSRIGSGTTAMVSINSVAVASKMDDITAATDRTWWA